MKPKNGHTDHREARVARKDSLLKQEKAQLPSGRGYLNLGCPLAKAKACAYIPLFLPGRGNAGMLVLTVKVFIKFALLLSLEEAF